MVKPEFDWGEEFETFLNSLSTKEEAQFRADCATFFHYAEYGIYLAEHL